MVPIAPAKAKYIDANLTECTEGIVYTAAAGSPKLKPNRWGLSDVQSNALTSTEDC